MIFTNEILRNTKIYFEMEVQHEYVNITEPMDKILSDYVKRFHEIKTPHSMIFSFKY